MLVTPQSVADTTRDPRWQPLRVTARMAEPITTDTDPIHLDGPLSWCAYLDHESSGGQLPPITPEWATDFDLGMATWTRQPSTTVADPRVLAADSASTWGWACSAGYVPALLRTVAHTRRPVPVREIARYTGAKSVHTGAGPHKARNVPHAAVWAPTVTWWCLGDPVRIAQLIPRLRGLGRLTRHGHGRVLGVDITPDEDAHRRWMWREWPDPASPYIGACRAPYHHGSRRMPCTPAGEPPWV